MKLKDIFYLGSIIALCITEIVLYLDTPKIAYVRALDMFEQYDGMKEASELFKLKHDRWKQEVDSLNANLTAHVEIFKKQRASLSDSEARKQELNIAVLQENYSKRIANIEQLATEEDHKMTASVLERINEFVKGYGEDNGYSIIFATVADGEMIYGDNALDITDRVIDDLNKEYKGR